MSARIGGQLIVTVRKSYFRNRIKRRMIPPVAEIEVPEWAELDRDQILAAHGIKGTDLRAKVAASLKNPRILGIALDLLQNTQIRELDELSVSRLLFEHIRASERDAPSPQPARERNWNWRSGFATTALFLFRNPKAPTDGVKHQLSGFKSQISFKYQS